MPVKPAVGKAALGEAMSLWPGATGQLGAEIQTQVSDGNTVMHERTNRFSLNSQEHATPVAAPFEIQNGPVIARREYFNMSPFASL